MARFPWTDHWAWPAGGMAAGWGGPKRAVPLETQGNRRGSANQPDSTFGTWPNDRSKRIWPAA